jgi:acetylornithine/N-succinyldiaminopimelate aminotransferase
MSEVLMGTYNRLPVAFESGSGVWLTDTNGKRYLDALAGIAVCGLGHAHPELNETLARQSSSLIHTSNLYEVPLQEKLAERLCELSGLDKVFFSNSGAEANEAAIKICRRYGHQLGYQVPYIVVMNNSFHGRTMATMTATGNNKIKEGFEPLVEGFIHIAYNDINALENIFDEQKDIVAVMLEPILGEGGIVIPDNNYLKDVRKITEKNNALMVLDEIQTGMCRTGKWFACQHEGVTPDIMTLAKSLGNGVPIGACLANDLAAAPMTIGSHGSTFGGNPLAASAALTVIDVLTKENLDTRAYKLGNTMLDEFKSRLQNVTGVTRIQGKGLMLGIELEKPCAEIVTTALERGILLNVTAQNVVRLLPPLITSDVEAEKIVSMVSDLIQDFLRG